MIIRSSQRPDKQNVLMANKLTTHLGTNISNLTWPEYMYAVFKKGIMINGFEPCMTSPGS